MRAHAHLQGVDITKEEGAGKIYMISVRHTNELYPERLEFSLKINRKALLQKYREQAIDWVFSDVEAWDREGDKPVFLFNFPLSLQEQKDGWYSATFEISEKLAKHSEITLYCVSKTSSFAVNAHIKLATHIPGKQQDSDNKSGRSSSTEVKEHPSTAR